MMLCSWCTSITSADSSLSSLSPLITLVDVPPLARPFFCNYFSLGFDLFFSDQRADFAGAAGDDIYDDDADAGDVPRLSKVIVHSNALPHAAFGRYQRLPWRFAQRSIDGADLAYDQPAVSRRGGGAGVGGEHGNAAGTNGAAGSAPSLLRSYAQLAAYLDGRSEPAQKGSSSSSAGARSGSGATANEERDRERERETMLLDRSADTLEFKGLLELDVSSSLHGSPGCVLEVNSSDQRVSGVTILPGTGTGGR